MNSSDFIQIKLLEGDLIIYHKKQDLGLTVSTQELVIQRPHLNYYLKLKDIISIIPYYSDRGRSVSLISRDHSSREISRLSGESGSYRLFVSKAIIHSRSGLSEIGKIEFVLPIANVLLDKIALYGAFEPIDPLLE
jgi:hypothetical protein